MAIEFSSAGSVDMLRMLLFLSFFVIVKKLLLVMQEQCTRIQALPIYLLDYSEGLLVLFALPIWRFVSCPLPGVDSQISFLQLSGQHSSALHVRVRQDGSKLESLAKSCSRQSRLPGTVAMWTPVPSLARSPEAIKPAAEEYHSKAIKHHHWLQYRRSVPKWLLVYPYLEHVVQPQYRNCSHHPARNHPTIA